MNKTFSIAMFIVTIGSLSITTINANEIGDIADERAFYTHQPNFSARNTFTKDDIIIIQRSYGHYEFGKITKVLPNGHYNIKLKQPPAQGAHPRNRNSVIKSNVSAKDIGYLMSSHIFRSKPFAELDYDSDSDTE